MAQPRGVRVEGLDHGTPGIGDRPGFRTVPPWCPASASAQARRGGTHRRDERFRQSLIDQDQVGPAGRPATCQERRAADRQSRLAGQSLSAQHGRQPGLERLLGVQGRTCADVFFRLVPPTAQAPGSSRSTRTPRPDPARCRSPPGTCARQFSPPPLPPLPASSVDDRPAVRRSDHPLDRRTTVRANSSFPPSATLPPAVSKRHRCCIQPRLVLEPDRRASLMPVAAGPS